jgi:fructose-1,6-bisphosphatase/inositol monophosphatase family enzyme
MHNPVRNPPAQGLRLRRFAAALVAAAVAVGMLDVVLSPDPLSPDDAAMLSLAVLAAGGVAGGWNAVQLAAGRGHAAADMWTLTWLCMFAAWIAVLWLRLAF